MKDAVRLVVYFVAVLLVGALIAPVLFWTAQSLIAHGIAPFLGRFDFQTFFHRALMIAAVALIWPLFRSIEVGGLRDLGLEPDPKWRRHLAAGILFALVPLLCCGGFLIAAHVYSLRSTIQWGALGSTLAAAIFVPLIEESFFRGLVLGILLRSGRKLISIFLTSAFFSVVHFLKAPEGTSTPVTWTSGFASISHSFGQFGDPILVLAAFTTLFVLGWILADARLRTYSLWLPMGLHAGWILGNGVFSKVARRELLLLPWIGKNLLIGIIPLGVACLTWIIVWLWLRHEDARES